MRDASDCKLPLRCALTIRAIHDVNRADASPGSRLPPKASAAGEAILKRRAFAVERLDVTLYFARGLAPPGMTNGKERSHILSS